MSTRHEASLQDPVPLAQLKLCPILDKRSPEVKQ